MRRRSFLKLVGVASTATVLSGPMTLAAVAAASKTVSSGGRMYRADGGGRVSVSADRGKTWALHSDLGSDYSVTRLTVDRADRLVATVGFQAWTFKLLLGPNLKSWLTT